MSTGATATTAISHTGGAHHTITTATTVIAGGGGVAGGGGGGGGGGTPAGQGAHAHTKRRPTASIEAETQTSCSNMKVGNIITTCS